MRFEIREMKKEIRKNQYTKRSTSDAVARASDTFLLKSPISNLISQFFYLVSLLFLIFNLISLISATPAHAGVISKPTNNLGLVAYWSFNEGVGTLATDSSGSGNHFDLLNGATWQNGRFGSGAYTDGVNDFGRASTTVSSYPFTISAWIKDEGTVSLAYTGANVPYYFIRLSNGTASMAFRPDASIENTSISAVATTSISGFVHVVGVYLSDTEKQLYVNGDFIAVNTNTRAFTTSIDQVLIGTYRTSNAAYHNGVTDEARIYNRALSASEIEALYRSGQATLARTPALITDGLVGWWTMDGADINWNTNTITDRSGNGNTGTLVNMSTSTSPVEGRVGQGLLSVRGTLNRVSVPQSSSINDLESLSVTLWSKLFSVTPSIRGYIAKLDDNTGGHGWWFISFPTNSSLEFKQVYDSTDLLVLCSNAVSAGGWDFYSVTWDGTAEADNVHIYKNGIELSCSTRTDGVGNRVTDSGRPLFIANGRDNADQELDGIIDDVRIYNRALSLQEIQTLYNGTSPTFQASSVKGVFGTNLISHKTFDGKHTNWNTYVLTDAGLNTGTFSMRNMATASVPVSGKVGQAFSFDGINDYVFGPVDGTPNTGTLSLWMRPNSFASNDNIWSYGNDSTSDNHMYLHASKYATLDFIRAASTNGEISPVNIGFARSLLPLGEWSHVVATWSPNRSALYLNGVVQSTSTGVTTSFSAAQNSYAGTGELAHFDSFRSDTLTSWSKQGSPYYNNGAIRMDASANIYFDVPSDLQDDDWDLYFRFREPTKDSAEGMEVRITLNGIAGGYAVFDRFESSNWYRIHWGGSTQTSEAVNMTANTWYRGRISKRGTNMSWFVDDNQIGSTVNIGSDRDTTRIAFYNTPTGSGTAEFDDIRWAIVNSSGSRIPATYFDGALDDIRLYDTELSAEEVRGLYNATK